MKLLSTLSIGLLLCALSGCVFTPNYRYSGGPDGYYTGERPYDGAGPTYYGNPWTYGDPYYGGSYYAAPLVSTRIFYSNGYYAPRRGYRNHARYRSYGHRDRHAHGSRGHHGNHHRGDDRTRGQHNPKLLERRVHVPNGAPPVRTMQSRQRSGSGLAPPPRQVHPTARSSHKSSRKRNRDK